MTMMMYVYDDAIVRLTLDPIVEILIIRTRIYHHDHDG